jgi:hypothetical protein
MFDSLKAWLTGTQNTEDPGDFIGVLWAVWLAAARAFEQEPTDKESPSIFPFAVRSA